MNWELKSDEFGDEWYEASTPKRGFRCVVMRDESHPCEDYYWRMDFSNDFAYRLMVRGIVNSSIPDPVQEDCERIVDSLRL